MAYHIIIDGLDGIGKGVILNAVVDHVREQGHKVFNLDGYWKDSTRPFIDKDHDVNDIKFWKQKTLSPSANELKDYDFIILSEPTFTGIGRFIRETIINKDNKGRYSAKTTAEAYAMDRLILYEQIVIPALDKGISIIQSRSICSSLTYQPIQAAENGEEITMDDILAIPGNKFVMEHPPDLLIIPTIENPEELMKRLEGREKDDNAIFENLEFQIKLKPVYESEDIIFIFESRGATVEYLDAGISVESSQEQAVKIYKDFVKEA